MPDGVRASSSRIKDRLEQHYRDMQDIEFTVQEGRLYILQTRSGKRTAAAAVRIAVEIVREQRDRSGHRPPPGASRASLHQLLVKRFGARAKDTAVTGGRSLARGLPATPGRGRRQGGLRPREGGGDGACGKKVILVRAETSPEDVAGMHAAQGVLTSRGGLTSHAAVVARGWGKAASWGRATWWWTRSAVCSGRAGRWCARGRSSRSNGATGEVIMGALPLVDPELVATSSGSSSAGPTSARTTGVRANADTPARRAPRPASSGRRASGWCAPSTCSSRRTASRSCAR